MNYRQLQSELKQYRALGYKTPALNSKKAVLQAAYDEIQSKTTATFTLTDKQAKALETPKKADKKVETTTIKKSTIRSQQAKIAAKHFRARPITKKAAPQFTKIGNSGGYQYIEYNNIVMFAPVESRLDAMTGLPKYAGKLADRETIVNQIITHPLPEIERHYGTVVVDYICATA